ncbi:hypothetical protein [Mycobacterium sp. ACS4331]|uniref:hypothetical protein n=1 Tax=Mycobacterium sp. ACS4331 TaxID=1834121 RepID=UPI0007FD09C1|nr:hypothetical protein [Mycobacterium sp. ACS4331]OBF29164.1 hypothetical protein A5727_24280 [Mycobacterium sp. ACS4331]
MSEAITRNFGEALRAPLRIGISGRRGVGRRAVTAVIAASGHPLAGEGQRPDVRVHVLAEVCKPEDRRILDRGDVDLVVVNKADLAGLGGDGPMARSHRLAAHLTATTGVSAVPLAALPARAAVDETVVGERVLAAVRTLVAHPADMSSADAFVDGVHPMSAGRRARLVSELGLFGVAHAVLTVRGDPDADATRLREVFRAVSGLDGLLDGLGKAGAPARYRRLVAAHQALEARAVTDTDAAEFLHADDTVLALMDAAADVLRAAGAAATARRAPRAQAIRWRRYAAGPVSTLHRQCGLDLARGSLRLLESEGRA